MRRALNEKVRTIKHGWLGLPYFPVRATDCFITSWPRSGNTWMRYMVSAIRWPDENLDLSKIDQRIPQLGTHTMRKRIKAMQAEPLRVFKSHEIYRPYYLDGKVAYLVRNGRDSITSFHHYLSNMKALQISLSDCVRGVCEGSLPFGSWHGNVRGWLEHKSHPNMLVIRYEDMLANPAVELKRTLDHFALPYKPEGLDAAVKAASVDRVNQGFQKLAVHQNKQFTGGLGGGTGKGKAVFSEADEALFQKYCGPLMRELGYA